MRKAELKATFKNHLSGNGDDVHLMVRGGYVKGDALIEMADTGRVLAVIRRASKWNVVDYLTANGQVRSFIPPFPGAVRD